MSKLPKIGRDVAADNYVLSEDIGRMVGKTIKAVRLGRPESKITLHGTEVLHIEFTDGETLCIYTGSNVTEFDSFNKPEDFEADFMFAWDPETRGS